MLLFRGADKDVRNYNSQTAFQVRACWLQAGLPGMWGFQCPMLPGQGEKGCQLPI